MAKLKNILRDIIITKNVENGQVSAHRELTKVPVSQVDPSVKEAIKRVNDVFDAQQPQLDARAFVAHEINCDPFTCAKNPCFMTEPDKIVSQPYIVDGLKLHNNYYISPKNTKCYCSYDYLKKNGQCMCNL